MNRRDRDEFREEDKDFLRRFDDDDLIDGINISKRWIKDQIPRAGVYGAVSGTGLITANKINKKIEKIVGEIAIEEHKHNPDDEKIKSLKKKLKKLKALKAGLTTVGITAGVKSGQYLKGIHYDIDDIKLHNEVLKERNTKKESFNESTSVNEKFQEYFEMDVITEDVLDLNCTGFIYDSTVRESHTIQDEINKNITGTISFYIAPVNGVGNVKDPVKETASSLILYSVKGMNAQPNQDIRIIKDTIRKYHGKNLEISKGLGSDIHEKWHSKNIKSFDESISVNEKFQEYFEMGVITETERDSIILMLETVNNKKDQKKQKILDNQDDLKENFNDICKDLKKMVLSNNDSEYTLKIENKKFYKDHKDHKEQHYLLTYSIPVQVNLSKSDISKILSSIADKVEKEFNSSKKEFIKKGLYFDNEKKDEITRFVELHYDFY